MDDLRSEVLIRQLVGIASPRSLASLRRWIDEDPAFAEHVARMRAAWEEAGVVAERHDPEPALARVIARIDRDAEPAPPDLRPVARSPVRAVRHGPGAARAAVSAQQRGWLRWAAAVALAAGLAFWGQHVLRSPQLVIRATVAGETATLRLGDGSEVLLGPETELHFPARFRGRTRDVRLRGSAYFNVSSDERRPFMVHATGTVTRVLGTRFLVRAYEDDTEVEVAVAEGQVTVRRDTAPESDAAVVSEGQLARVHDAGGAEVVDDANIDALLSWTEGRVVFSARPLPEVVRELERWYGQTIRIAEPSVAERRVTLSFEDTSLDEILEVLAVSLELRVEPEGDGVVLYDATAIPRR